MSKKDKICLLKPLALAVSLALVSYSHAVEIVDVIAASDAQETLENLTGAKPAVSSAEMLTAESEAQKDALAQDASIATADFMEGSPETELIMYGNAELRQPGTVLKATQLTYKQETGVVEGEGDTEISREGVTFWSPRFQYNIDEKTGQATKTEFEYAPNRLRGEASCVRFQSGDKIELDDTIVTTCKKGDNSWRIELGQLTLDEYEEVAYGKNAVLKFGNVPVFGLPWFTFPAGVKRKTGFLLPMFGYSKNRGVDIEVPYYFNIAPNYDYTFIPRVMTKSGVLLGNEIRWKNRLFETSVYGSFLPSDRSYRDRHPEGLEKKDHPNRWGVAAKLNGAKNGFSYFIDYNRVSDGDYISDYSSDIEESSSNILNQEFSLSYNATYFNGTVRSKKNQLLDVDGYYTRRGGKLDSYKPYEIVPQATLNGYAADVLGFELTTNLEATRFKHATRLQGDRFVVNQKVAFPLQGAGWFFTPKAEFLGTWYKYDDIKRDRSITDKSPKRLIPIYSADAGLVFERGVRFGDSGVFKHLLEPRVFYAYIPKKDQSQIYNFDSSISDISYAQLFNENEWSGYDRVSAANHITGALTNRIVDNDTGEECFRFTVGQRYYFKDYELKSNGTFVTREDNKADLLASVGARLFKTLTLDATGQYSYKLQNVKRGYAGLKWQPRPRALVGLYYRYDKTRTTNIDHTRQLDDNIHQIDFAAQIPVTDNFNVVGRVNYSFLDKTFIDAVAGFEYDHDCWSFRTVWRRYVQSDRKIDSTFYVQLELRGLGSIGTNATGVLRDNVTGYQTREDSTSNASRMGPNQNYNYYR